MATNIQIVAFPLNANLETALQNLVNSPPGQGFRLVSSFSPPVVNGQIMVYFVFEKEG